MLSSKKSVVNEIEKKVHTQWKKNYYPSHENLLRSLNVYYAQDVMGKAKYRATRKANQSDSVPNFVPYPSLSKYIREIDIGELYDVQDKFGEGVVNEDPADGVCRSLSKYAIRLAQFYFCVNRNRVDKLLTFKCFPKKNHNSTLFVIGLGGDGAPEVGTAILISFLNVANRIASSSENVLLFGANVGETATVVKRYIQELIADVRYSESQTFEVVFDGISFPVEFKLGELPNDMKMLFLLASYLMLHFIFLHLLMCLVKHPGIQPSQLVILWGTGTHLHMKNVLRMRKKFQRKKQNYQGQIPRKKLSEVT